MRRPSTCPASSPERRAGRARARGRLIGLVALLTAPGACGDDGPSASGSDATATMSSASASTGSDGTASSADATESSADETAAPPPPDCDPGQVACGSVCTDLDADPSNCGQCGRSCVIPQAAAACAAGECSMAACDPGWSDCDGELVTGCETPIDCQEGAPCQTTCGSDGTVDCTDVCASAGEPVCITPVEVCNVMDDDCDEVCDQGPLPGCRVGVHRSYSPTLAHYYTTDLAAAQSGDFSLESENFFHLYAPGVEGLQPLFSCVKPNGKRFLTTATDCEIVVAPELTVGFISMDDRCGSIPLYRLRNVPADAHFYTTSAGERDNAVNNLGFADEGIAGYVWSGP